MLQVLIYRLITRGTIEERMMQMTKKKMVLEHLVVGRLKAQNINQVDNSHSPSSSLPSFLLGNRVPTCFFFPEIRNEKEMYVTEDNLIIPVSKLLSGSRGSMIIEYSSLFL